MSLHGYQYVVLRCVPRVEREEFLNVGVVLYCPTRRFLDARIDLQRDRLAALGVPADLDLIEQHLRTIPAICAGDPGAGPMAALPLSERFHWLVAPRSTVVQTSPVHTGLTEDPPASLDHLLATMVRVPG